MSNCPLTFSDLISSQRTAVVPLLYYIPCMADHPNSHWWGGAGQGRVQGTYTLLYPLHGWPPQQSLVRWYRAGQGTGHLYFVIYLAWLTTPTVTVRWYRAGQGTGHLYFVILYTLHGWPPQQSLVRWYRAGQGTGHLYFIISLAWLTIPTVTG